MSSYEKSVISYYASKGFNKVSFRLHAIIDARLAKQNIRFLPLELRLPTIVHLNDVSMIDAYSDKSLYPTQLPSAKQPYIYLHAINGIFYDSTLSELTPEQAERIIWSLDEGIIKPSRQNNGLLVALLSIDNNSIFLDNTEVRWGDILKLYKKNFIVQERVKQSQFFSHFHESSVNTLRLVTLRWKETIHSLPSFIRIGANNSIKDNAGSGGVCVGINSQGVLNSYAVDKRMSLHSSHPTTHVNFHTHQYKVPEFESIVQLVKELHHSIPHHRLISWDIAVAEDGSPIFIEHNFKGAFWLYQMATGEPLFGDLSEEVISYLSEQNGVVCLAAEDNLPKNGFTELSIDGGTYNMVSTNSETKKLVDMKLYAEKDLAFTKLRTAMLETAIGSLEEAIKIQIATREGPET